MKIIATSYINTPAYNDPETWLERIDFYAGVLEALAKKHELVSIEQINYSGRVEKNGMHYHFLNYKKKKLRFPFGLHSYIKKLNPDIVLVHGLVFPFQVMLLKKALERKTKILVQHHAEKPFRGFRKYLQQYADRFIDAYFFVSKEMGTAWVKQGIIGDEKKIFEVMEVSSRFQPMDKTEAIAVTKAKGNPVFLWVGRLDINKDPLTVVKAFGQFIQKEPLARLYMVYHTEDLKEEVMGYIAKENLQKNIIMVGKVPHQEMQYWYSSAGFIISGSHYEGSGVAVCEAMSCGCIPVLTNITSFRKMTGPGKCGLLYEPGDVVGLLNVLLKTNELDLEIEKNKVLEQFKDGLSFEAIGEKINMLINSL